MSTFCRSLFLWIVDSTVPQHSCHFQKMFTSNFFNSSPGSLTEWTLIFILLSLLVLFFEILLDFFLFFYFHLLYSRFLLVNLSSVVIFNFLSLARVLSFSNSIFCFLNSCFLSLVFYSVLLFVLVLHFPTFSLWNFFFPLLIPLLSFFPHLLFVRIHLLVFSSLHVFSVLLQIFSGS